MDIRQLLPLDESSGIVHCFTSTVVLSGIVKLDIGPVDNTIDLLLLFSSVTHI